MPKIAGPSNGDLTLDRIYPLSDIDDADFSMAAWSPDGKLLTYVLTNSKSARLIAVDLASLEKRVLFDWAKILDPAAVLRTGMAWDANSETVPWRIRNTDQLDDSFLYYNWSPNGKQILLAPSMDGPYYLFEIASEALIPLAIDPNADDIEFSPDGRWLTYVLNYNLVILDTANGLSIPLTQAGRETFRYATPDSLGDFLPNGYWWSPDSSRLACLVTDEVLVPEFRRQRLTSLVGAVDKERFPRPGCPNPQMRLQVISAQGQTWIAGGPSPDYYLARVQWINTNYLALQFLSREQNHLILAIADVNTGDWRPILEERSPSWINLADDLTFLDNGNVFLWSSERYSYRQLFLYSVDGHELAQLTSGDFASVAVKGIDEENGAVYFRAYPSPFIDSHLMRVSYEIEGDRVTVGKVENLTPSRGAHETKLSPDCSFFAEQFSTVTTPPVLRLYDRDGNLLAELENGIDKELGPMLQPVDFPPLLPAAKIGDASDDMMLCHRIIRPPGMQEGQKYPAIVYVYGGPVPGGSSRTVVNKWVHVPDLWAQMMAHLGFVVYSLDNRGSCEAPRGHRFERAIRYQLGVVELADQLEGVKYLKSLPFVNPERIGVFGGSFGGFMALNCMLRAPDVFKTGVAFAPVTDWNGYDAIYTEHYMGPPTQNIAGYQLTMLPPIASPLRGKLLLLHGTADQDVHLHHTCTLLEALVKAGKQVELMMYPGMTHVDFFEVSPLGKQLFERITGFFTQHL